MVGQGVIAFGETVSRFPMTMPLADESPAASAAGDVFQEVELFHGSIQAVESRVGFHFIEVSTCSKSTVVFEQLGIDRVIGYKAFTTIDVFAFDHDASAAFDVFDRLTVDEELLHGLTTMT